MKKSGVFRRILTLFVLTCCPAARIPADGGYFSRAVAVSTDQRVIIVRTGDRISMTLSTGYTGGGDEFAWIIPTPVPPAQADVTESGEKGESAFTALDRLTAPQFSSGGRKQDSGCFPAGVEVLTEKGLRPIETLDSGERVYTCDPTSGNWGLARILRRLDLQYEGDMIAIRAGQATLRATGNHPFLVLRGEQLDSRPRALDVPKAGNRFATGGRWVEARHLRAGDVLKEKGGPGLAVTAVSSRIEKADVYNLEVEGSPTYAVNREGILVHNKGSLEAKGPAESPETVTVLGKVLMEHYEASILGATGASPLMEWLAKNGYRVNPEARQILELYIAENWAFVAVKLRPAQRRRYSDEFLPPLTISYSCERIVFPLRISAVSTAQEARITLYVIAENTVSASNFPTAELVRKDYLDYTGPRTYIVQRIRDTVGTEGRGLAVLWAGELADWPLNLKLYELTSIPLFADREEQKFLTRLEARLGPAGMSQDIHFVPDMVPRRFSVHFGP